MRLSTSLLLSAGISAVSALSDASVYIFDGEQRPISSSPPTLTPEEARLIFAQRLGVSEYHGLGDASESTLAYINTYGGPQESLFGLSQDKAAELVLIVEGVSSKDEELLRSKWNINEPQFKIPSPPSTSSNVRLAKELQAQIGTSSEDCSFEDAINPFAAKCWVGKSKIIHIDLASEKPGFDDLLSAQARLLKFASRNEMHVTIVIMPEICRTVKSSSKPYGSYAMPAQSHLARRQQAEEPITEEEPVTLPFTQSKQFHASNSSEPKSLPPVPPRCYTSLDACTNLTNSCSGHGECYQRSGPKGTDKEGSCFACMCKETKDFFDQGEKKIPSYRVIHWGGGACQKKDVSGPFWLFATFTIVMIGLVSWAIGMLFSIGEEKLPGVIGAGVSSGKVR